ncbi:MAG TPA: Na+/H+ antiporter subunit E [Acidimicrobiales bacterium]|nr:Na+/H+ antiporter subunit E [Acidimicrobiales bacterium]
MSGYLLPTVWLVLVWVALWEDLSPASVLGGLVTAGALMAGFRLRHAAASSTLRPLGAVRFVAYFLWKLVEASAVVAWEVVTPSDRIKEGIVAVPVRGISDALITVVANAISLTPGTLTLEVDREPTTLYVHVLHLHDIEAARRDIRHLEALAIRAFGSADAVRSLAADGGPPKGAGR